MSEKLLSIIVPSYNMEKYLPKCLGSLVVAPELMRQLEVLVVNDGSKDRTSEIAHEFAAKWPRTFQVIDKENGNYGSCINAALPVASGLYVKVLDADDWFETAAFEHYLRQLDTRAEADLILSDYDKVDPAGRQIEHLASPFRHEGVFDVDDFLVKGSRISMHAFAYRREVLVKLGYRQLEGVSYTDTEWVLLPLLNVRTVSYIPSCVYKYLCGREGQTMETGTVNKNWWMLGDIALHMVEQFLRMKDFADGQVQDNIRRRISSMLESVYRTGLIRVGVREAGRYLRDFDTRLKALSIDWYNDFSNVGYSRFIPFHFIRRWREGDRFVAPILQGCKFSTDIGRLLKR